MGPSVLTAAFRVIKVLTTTIGETFADLSGQHRPRPPEHGHLPCFPRHPHLFIIIRPGYLMARSRLVTELIDDSSQASGRVGDDTPNTFIDVQV